MKIWILKIDTKKSGDIITAHTSQERAKAELYNYVAQNWDQGITDQHSTCESLTRDEAIEAYFDVWGEALDGEWYKLDEIELEGAENLINPSAPLMTALDGLEELLNTPPRRA